MLEGIAGRDGADQSSAFDLTDPEPSPEYDFDQSPPQDGEI